MYSETPQFNIDDILKIYNEGKTPREIADLYDVPVTSIRTILAQNRDKIKIYPINRRREALGKDQIQDVIRRYKEGETQYSIALLYGLTPSTIGRYIHKYSDLSAHPGRPSFITEEDVDEFVRMSNNGVPQTQIAKKFGISVGTVYVYLTKRRREGQENT